MTAEHVVGTCKPSVLAAVIGQQDPLPRHLLQVRYRVTDTVVCRFMMSVKFMAELAWSNQRGACYVLLTTRPASRFTCRTRFDCLSRTVCRNACWCRMPRWTRCMTSSASRCAAVAGRTALAQTLTHKPT